MKPFNKLSPAEAERLAYLLEELGEVQRVIGKILRHGYESYDPSIACSPTNREDLEMELRDVIIAMGMMDANKDILLDRMELGVQGKTLDGKKWFHHQKD